METMEAYLWKYLIDALGSRDNRRTKKPTNCGTKTADVLDECFSLQT